VANYKFNSSSKRYTFDGLCLMDLLKYIAVFGSDNYADHDSDKRNSGLALQYFIFTDFPTCVVQVYELHCNPGDNDILLITVSVYWK